MKGKWIGGPIYNDGRNYIITVYFTHPKNICDGKIRLAGYVGDRLLIRTGNSSVMEIPLDQSGLVKTKWVEGQCFYGMGK